MNMYRNFNRIRASIIHFMAGRMIMIASAILVSLMLVRGLSILEFAQYVALMGLMLVATMISDAGIKRVQPRFLPELYIKKDIQGLIFLSRALICIRMLFHGSLLGVIWLLSTLWLDILEFKLEDSLVLIFVGYAFFYALNEQTQRNMQVLLLQKAAAKVIALEWLFKMLMMGALYDGPNSLALLDILWIQATSVCVAFVIGQLIVWKKTRDILTNEHNVQMKSLALNEVLQFAWKNWAQALLSIPLSSGGVRIFMAGVTGPVSLAYLGFSYTIMHLLQRVLPSKMIAQVIEPVYFARYKELGDFRDLNNMVSLMVKLNYFLLVPVMAWFLLGSYDMLDWISAGKYADSGWMIAVLILILMFENHRMGLQSISNAVDQSGLLVQSSLLANLLLPLYVLAAMYWDLYGLLLGLVFISWARNSYLIYKLRQRGFPYTQDWSNLFYMFIAGFIGWVVVSFSLPLLPGVLGSFIAMLIFAIVFYGIGLKVKFFKPAERALINKTLGRNIFNW